MLQQFKAAPAQFFREFGMTALRGVLAWCLLAPIAAAALYFGLLPLLRRVAALRSTDRATHGA